MKGLFLVCPLDEFDLAILERMQHDERFIDHASLDQGTPDAVERYIMNRGYFFSDNAWYTIREHFWAHPRPIHLKALTTSLTKRYHLQL